MDRGDRSLKLSRSPLKKYTTNNNMMTLMRTQGEGQKAGEDTNARSNPKPYLVKK